MGLGILVYLLQFLDRLADCSIVQVQMICNQFQGVSMTFE